MRLCYCGNCGLFSDFSFEAGVHVLPIYGRFIYHYLSSNTYSCYSMISAGDDVFREESALLMTSSQRSPY